jgi:hypothetical protein
VPLIGRSSKGGYAAIAGNMTEVPEESGVKLESLSKSQAPRSCEQFPFSIAAAGVRVLLHHKPRFLVRSCRPIALVMAHCPTIPGWLCANSTTNPVAPQIAVSA